MSCVSCGRCFVVAAVVTASALIDDVLECHNEWTSSHSRSATQGPLP